VAWFILSLETGCSSTVANDIVIRATLAEKMLAEPNIRWESVPAVRADAFSSVECNPAPSERGTRVRVIAELTPVWSAVNSRSKSARVLTIDHVELWFGMPTDTGRLFFAVEAAITGRFENGERVELNSGWVSVNARLGLTETLASSPWTTPRFSDVVTVALLRALSGESEADARWSIDYFVHPAEEKNVKPR